MAPALSFASASKCTVHLSGSSVADLIEMLSVPGLIIPVMALPSQFSTNSTSSPWTLLPDQVPIHDPFKGCPSWATADPPAKATSVRASTNVNTRICLYLSRIFPVGVLLEDCGLILHTNGVTGKRRRRINGKENV